jgi:hypothetical protein
MAIAHVESPFRIKGNNAVPVLIRSHDYDHYFRARRMLEQREEVQSRMNRLTGHMAGSNASPVKMPYRQAQ